MIACVTFETVKVSDPAYYFGSNVVYLLHHVRDPSPENVYQQFYDRTAELITGRNPGAEIVETDVNVSDFAGLLSTINGIIASETAKGSEIRINLSAGSPEFTAAGATAAMMSTGVEAFFVHAESYTVSDEDLRDIYYRDGKPVGLTASVRDTEDLPEFKLEMPDETLVRALRRYSVKLNEGRVHAFDMIDDLREHGLWERRGRSDPNNDKVFFQRRYIDEWRKKGWIVKDGPAYRMTDSGNLAVKVLYPETSP